MDTKQLFAKGLDSRLRNSDGYRRFIKNNKQNFMYYNDTLYKKQLNASEITRCYDLNLFAPYVKQGNYDDLCYIDDFVMTQKYETYPFVVNFNFYSNPDAIFQAQRLVFCWFVHRYWAFCFQLSLQEPPKDEPVMLWRCWEERVKYWADNPQDMGSIWQYLTELRRRRDNLEWKGHFRNTVYWAIPHHARTTLP